MALLLVRRKLRDRALVRRVVSHHVVVGGLMGWYLFAAARNKAKGVFFVASYMVGLIVPCAASTCTTPGSSLCFLHHSPSNSLPSSGPLRVLLCSLQIELISTYVDHELLHPTSLPDLVSQAVYCSFVTRHLCRPFVIDGGVRGSETRLVCLASSSYAEN